MRTYKCIPWNIHPKHTEEEVASAIATLRDVASVDEWSTLINYTLNTNHAHSSWAHWACRAVERAGDAQGVALVVSRTLNLVKHKLSGPVRREAPRAWYRHVWMDVPNPMFGTPGQKKNTRIHLGYIVGNGVCVKTFRPYSTRTPEGTPL